MAVGAAPEEARTPRGVVRPCVSASTLRRSASRSSRAMRSSYSSRNRYSSFSFSVPNATRPGLYAWCSYAVVRPPARENSPARRPRSPSATPASRASSNSSSADSLNPRRSRKSPTAATLSPLSSPALPSLLCASPSPGGTAFSSPSLILLLFAFFVCFLKCFTITHWKQPLSFVCAGEVLQPMHLWALAFACPLADVSANNHATGYALPRGFVSFFFFPFLL